MKNKELMEKELNKIKDILVSIKEIAEKDGNVTGDELAILKMIDQDLNDYKEILSAELANENDEISPVSRQKLNNYKKQIFEHARNIAASDGRFNEDEWHILEKLHELVE